MTGIDAEITLKKFSRPDIQMDFIDRPDLGWDKAFQPNFGLPGLVQPYQNWYVDFELKFYLAGTNTLKVMPKVDMTALDVDGDGNSINEYAVFQNPSNVMYSTINYLINQPAGILGQLFTCPLDSIASALIACPNCGGDGKIGTWKLTDCPVCNGTGLLFATCLHPFDGVTGDTLEGPVQNFLNIDTSATQVMATYQFTDRSVINFRYGAKSSANSSNGTGIRLNSLWFRQFSLAPALKITSLPVKLLDFTAKYVNPDVLLEWSTSQEHNFSHFILEHSTDGTDFSQTAIILGAGESNSKIDYSYTDKDMKGRGGIIYYRLKQVDIDGKFDYSPVRIIRLGEENNSLALATFPNPVVNELRITLPSSWQNKHVYIDLYNANGQLVNSLQVANSGQTESISAASLKKGAYFINVRCGNENAKQKIIKN